MYPVERVYRQLVLTALATAISTAGVVVATFLPAFSTWASYLFSTRRYANISNF